ncbi:hypothetical protein OF83DRAFT_1089775, partial [Amylostereum chailletii]
RPDVLQPPGDVLPDTPPQNSPPQLAHPDMQSPASHPNTPPVNPGPDAMMALSQTIQSNIPPLGPNTAPPQSDAPPGESSLEAIHLNVTLPQPQAAHLNTPLVNPSVLSQEAVTPILPSSQVARPNTPPVDSPQAAPVEVPPAARVDAEPPSQDIHPDNPNAPSEASLVLRNVPSNAGTATTSGYNRLYRQDMFGPPPPSTAVSRDAAIAAQAAQSHLHSTQGARGAPAASSSRPKSAYELFKKDYKASIRALWRRITRMCGMLQTRRQSRNIPRCATMRLSGRKQGKGKEGHDRKGSRFGLCEGKVGLGHFFTGA